jgi:hypothetical protein
MEKEIKAKQQELKSMKVNYEVQKGVRQEKENKTRNSLKTIDELKGKKKDFITWSERLEALNRALIKNLWLSSLEINVKSAPLQGANNKDKKEDKKVEVTPREYTVNIQGATYSEPKKKPLKKVSEFMTKLMEEPFWGNYFSLRDWNISSLQEDTKVLSFQITLESKTL